MKIKEKSIPLSQIAKERILKYIESEKLGADDLLPSENALMEMLGVSRYTIREALALLEQDRIIYKIQGKGTFVNKKPMYIESGLEKLDSITEIIESFGYKPGTKWISIEEIEPNKDMIEKLNLKDGEKVITFKRLRTADEKEASYLVDTMPKKYLGNKVPKEIETESLFKYLEINFNISIEYAITEIIPTFPMEEMLDYMNVKNDSLFLLLHQIHYDKENRPMLYSFDYFNPEVFKFKINRTI
ncbi:GntR family transcriptional regulator [Clostridium sp. Cult3]|uniref:GntR family transcriptional regulator n=1 Tax=Clostridium sp. Cult3 TaxID=2079004 RepID=UPI001F3B438A|nr:GntR family transcriptional regulator [Clostridium sp. Cult3]MCF6460168.1 GntR family transcriptional regulator [Clostridium sp. Cult3]